MKKIFFIIALVFVLGAQSFVFAAKADRQVLNLEEEISLSGALTLDGKSGAQIDEETVKEAVKAALAVKDEKNGEISEKDLTVDIPISLKNLGKETKLVIDGELSEYAGEVDSFVINAGETYVFIKPDELKGGNGDYIQMSIKDNSGVMDDYTGRGRFKLLKKILGGIFAAAGLYLFLFSILFIPSAKFKNGFNKKAVTWAGAVCGIIFIALGAFLFFANISVAPSKNKVSLSSPEQAGFAVSYGSSYSNTEGIYLGLPLFDESFTKEYTVGFLKGSESGDSVIGGNYSEKYEVVKFPVKTAGEYYIKNNKIAFTDVSSSNEELFEAVSVLAAKNIVSGKAEGIYSADDPVTRAEAVTLMCKLLYLDSYKNGGGEDFSDVSRSSWYYSYVMLGKENGILQGYEDNTFRAENTISKQEFVFILGNVMKNKLKYNAPADYSCLTAYTDWKDISDWAKENAAILESMGIRIDGEEYEPLKAVTRGEAARLLYGVYSLIE